jgi:hypothetical protein
MEPGATLFRILVGRLVVGLERPQPIRVHSAAYRDRRFEHQE